VYTVHFLDETGAKRRPRDDVRNTDFASYGDANRWAILNASTEKGDITYVAGDNTPELVLAAYVSLSGVKPGRAGSVAMIDDSCGEAPSALPALAKASIAWHAEYYAKQART
jgi:hypothetical protein